LYEMKAYVVVNLAAKLFRRLATIAQWRILILREELISHQCKGSISGLC